jgi:hypothetical protein
MQFKEKNLFFVNTILLTLLYFWIGNNYYFSDRFYVTLHFKHNIIVLL